MDEAYLGVFVLVLVVFTFILHSCTHWAWCSVHRDGCSGVTPWLTSARQASHDSATGNTWHPLMCGPRTHEHSCGGASSTLDTGICPRTRRNCEPPLLLFSGHPSTNCNIQPEGPDQHHQVQEERTEGEERGRGDAISNGQSYAIWPNVINYKSTNSALVSLLVPFTRDYFALLLQKVNVVLPAPQTHCLPWLSLIINRHWYKYIFRNVWHLSNESKSTFSGMLPTSVQESSACISPVTSLARIQRCNANTTLTKLQN